MKYFSIEELVRSDTARLKGIDNTPSKEIVSNLNTLVNCCLDLLREAYGKPISVNSGFRCPELNKAVGGATSSSHTKGQAADITAGSKIENQKLWNLMVERGIPFTKMISEQNFSWIHISYDKDNLARKKMLGIKEEGKWKYISID